MVIAYFAIWLDCTHGCSGQMFAAGQWLQWDKSVYRLDSRPSSMYTQVRVWLRQTRFSVPNLHSYYTSYNKILATNNIATNGRSHLASFTFTTELTIISACSVLGLDTLCLKFCLLFYSLMLAGHAYYSFQVHPSDVCDLLSDLLF